MVKQISSLQPQSLYDVHLAITGVGCFNEELGFFGDLVGNVAGVFGDFIFMNAEQVIGEFGASLRMVEEFGVAETGSEFFDD